MTLKDFIRMVPYFQDVRVKGLVTYLDEFEHEIEHTMSVTLNTSSESIILPKALMMATIESFSALGDTIIVNIEDVDLTKAVR